MLGSRTMSIPYIVGDGIGPEIMCATRLVIDAVVNRAYSGDVQLAWKELPAGESAFRTYGEYIPRETLQEITQAGVALKGPLSTPVGGGIRSMNVALRQKLDLYCNIRPVRYFEGVPSPVKEPHKLDVVICRENTEDVYKGIEWKRGSDEALALLSILKDEFGVEVRGDSGIGIKPMSEFASKRLVRAAIRYAIQKNRRSVTLVHKGNIMKFTEGAFRDWGYELAKAEFGDMTITEAEIVASGKPRPDGKVLVNDRIADNMFQQILTRPSEYSVLATPNLNGDYLADACAAQVGGLGLAPGANIGDNAAVFEAVHGTAPKYAGKNLANPCALMLSGAMMLEHLSLGGASKSLMKAIERTLAEGILTQDLARESGSPRTYGTKEFSEEVAARI